MGKKYTHEQFKNLVSDRVILLGLYKNTWNPFARSLIRKYGCPECGKRKAKETKNGI